jgi:hypothetical protein
MTLEEIEKRLRVVEDVEEIKQLQYRYMNCVIFAKWDEIMDCFAEKSAIDFQGWEPTKGKTEIAKIFKEGLSKGHVGREGDFVVHPIISVDGDKAKGNWLMYMMWSYRLTGQSLFWAQGIYDAEYVRENGQWKFSFLRWRARLAPPGATPPFEGT